MKVKYKDFVFDELNNNELTLVKYEGYSSDVVVPEMVDGLHVTRIGDSVFEKCSNFLESIFLPDTIEIIGHAAFKNCYKLKKINLPINLKIIEDEAFYGCGSEFDNNMVFTGHGKGINVLILPENLETIGRLAFGHCVNLKSVYFLGSTKEIGSEAFSCCERIKEIVMPNNLEIIRSWAFWNCRHLESIALPDSLKIIENEAFIFCHRIKSIRLPKYLEQFDGTVLKRCSSLKSIEVDKENRHFISIDNVIYSKDLTQLIYYMPSKPEEKFIIPETVEYIGQSAFYECHNLQYLGSNHPIKMIDSLAIEDCENIKEINLMN